MFSVRSANCIGKIYSAEEMQLFVSSLMTLTPVDRFEGRGEKKEKEFPISRSNTTAPYLRFDMMD
jgi:hypothetical protein